MKSYETLTPHHFNLIAVLLVVSIMALATSSCASPEDAQDPANVSPNIEAPATEPASAVDPTVSPSIEVVETDVPSQEGENEAESSEESGNEAESSEESGNVAESSEVDQENVAQPITFEITSDGTEARFVIEEVLLGSKKIVTGTTSDVTGGILVTPSDPSATEFEPITINARDLTTDSSRRNRAIQRQILLTARDEYQYITFEPTAIEGLPDTISVGDSLEFSLTGNLTILDTTRVETFLVELEVISEAELQGLASLTVLHADFGLTIPNVPIVASVEDEVRLELEFTAKANQ